MPKRNPLTGTVRLGPAYRDAAGSEMPVKLIGARAREVGARFLLDACQSVPHMAVDVQQLGADFVVASSHKMLGPTGVGFLYAPLDLLRSMPPFLGARPHPTPNLPARLNTSPGTALWDSPLWAYLFSIPALSPSFLPFLSGRPWYALWPPSFLGCCAHVLLPLSELHACATPVSQSLPLGWAMLVLGVAGGGEMIQDVFLQESTFAEPPARFEAGTPAIAESVGLGAAIDYMRNNIPGALPAMHRYEVSTQGPWLRHRIGHGLLSLWSLGLSVQPTSNSLLWVHGSTSSQPPLFVDLSSPASCLTA